MMDERKNVRVKILSNAEFLPHVIELANAGHEVTIPLRGYSMRPFLEDGRDKAILVKINRKLQIGDVVLAEIRPGSYALHRLIYVDDSRVQMFGDGNITPDPIIPLENVKLIVRAFIRKNSDKKDFVDGTRFRIYSKVWRKLTPVRRWLLAVWSRMPLKLRNRLL